MAWKECSVCSWERSLGQTVDTSRSKTKWAKAIGTSEASVRRHFKHLHQELPTIPQLKWEPIQRVKAKQPVSRFRKASTEKWKTAIVAGDAQIGFRRFEDGSYDPFHDEQAISVALQIVGLENPDQVVFVGDMIDLPSQSRWAKEASFAQTTQKALDRTDLLLAETRANAENAKIVLVEGNHDARMGSYVEINTLEAFGIRKANRPNDWPVMSMQNLLNLEEYGVDYMDAYPAAHHWINDKLRAAHGTKSNSNGSTVAMYSKQTPHFSTVHGHSHRLELQSKTTYDRVGKLRSLHINPGCLCRTDGAVPSFNGSIHANGKPADIVEDWQQGVAVIKYLDSGEFFVNLVQIEDGFTVYQGQEIIA